MKKDFGFLNNGMKTYLYEISCGEMKAYICDYGATLVRLYVPDSNGNIDDIVLGFDSASEYDHNAAYAGAMVGRNANRIKNGEFQIGDITVQMPQNDNSNNVHSGPESYSFRLWNVEKHTNNSICLYLFSPNGDQGLPGNAEIRVTYALEDKGILRITYDAVSDQDTIFNLVNHSYFNLAGHNRPEKAKEQNLMIASDFYTVSNKELIPTGELCPVDGTPMDFRTAKPIGRDLGMDHPCIKMYKGYDLNFVIRENPCAVLADIGSGRSMTITTDCPGIQLCSGHALNIKKGKDGVSYGPWSGIALETQYYPDSVNHPEWPQPIYKAGQHCHSETVYSFVW